MESSRMEDAVAAYSDEDEAGESPCRMNPSSLDENGLPISPDDSDETLGAVNPLVTSHSGGRSFADEFYKAGTDWSSLLQEETGEKGRKRVLVQKNLFHMWGVKETDDKGGKKVSVQKDLFHMWGIVKKSRDCGTTPSSSGILSSGEFEKSKGVIVDNSHKDQKGGRHVARKHTVSRSNTFGPSRACPFYKKMPGTPFTVDAFRYGSVDGCQAYFLTHFHADHYGGLSKKWSHGLIYCTPLTARLVKTCLCVNASYIRSLEFNTEYNIEGIKVTLLEANHCPGAALIHFSLPDGRCYLHTGDFRACKKMQTYPLLTSSQINTLYLDTTYCNPKYRFPSKEEVVKFVIHISRSCLQEKPKTLIVVGAYSIGKEHVYVALSEALRINIYANASRRRVLEMFNWPELSGKLISRGCDCSLHVLPMSYLNHKRLNQYLKEYDQTFTGILAFRPTGWTYSEHVGNQMDLIKPSRNGNTTIYGVPYSEHSSFSELKDFVQFLRPEKVIPTVNIANKANREKMHAYFHEWLNK